MPSERQHHTVTLAVLTLAGTAFAFQQTMVFPALPEFQRQLGGTTAWVAWVLTAFLVSAAVTTPILGKLGDQFGKERMLLVSLGLFLAGSLGAAAAWNLESLIGFRALAGAGGAVFPLSFAIIRDEFPPGRVHVGIGLLSAVFGVGGGFGIVLSGVIVDHLDWRLLFLLGSAPVALSLALVALLVPLTEGERWGWGSAPTLGFVGLSAALFVLWSVVELNSRAPMVDMRMLAHRPVLLTNVTTMISGFALFSCFVLLPAFVEAPASRGYGFGATATEAGLYLLPSSLAMLLTGPLAGVVGRRVGSRWPLAVGMAMVAAAALILSQAHDEPWQVLLASALLGAGVGAAFAAMVALIAENVDPREMGVATGMNTVVRLVGATVGGQIGAALLTAQTISGTSAPAESAFVWAFGLSAVAATAAAGVALAIRKRPLRRLAPA